MPPPNTDALLLYKIEQLEEHIKNSDKAFADFKASIDAERTRYLIWGIGALGAGILAMGIWAFNLATGGHIK